MLITQRTQQLLSLGLGLMSLSFSACADLQSLVFMREVADSKQLYLSPMEAGGKPGQLQALTEGKQWHLYPDISADGTQLAYVQGAGRSELSLMVATIGKDQKLAKREKWMLQTGQILHPRFAQNGSLIFFSMPTPSGQRLAYLPLAQHRLSHHPKSVQWEDYQVAVYAVEPVILEEAHESYFPAPSADGNLIAYQRNVSSTQKEIVLWDRLANKKQVIGEGMSPALSKNGQWIAYTKQVDGNWDIYVYDRYQQKTTRATTNAANDFAPHFDRNEDLIFASNRLDKNFFNLHQLSFKDWHTSDKVSGSDLARQLVELESGSDYAPRVSGLLSYQQTSMPELPGTPRSSFGAIEHQGKVYVAGGHQGPEHTYPPESFTGRMTIFDRASNTWKQAAPRLHACHGFSLAARGNYLYAFGGFAYEASTSPKWKSLDVIERYDIAKDQWEVVGQLPRRRSSNVVAQVGDLVYLIGGWDSTPKHAGDIDGRFHSEIDVFNLVTGEVSTAKAELPYKRRAFTGVTHNNKIYLIGGLGEGGSHFSLIDRVTEWDPSTGIFKELAPLPFATFAPAAGFIKDELFVFGGMFKTGSYNYEYVPHIYRFDLNQKRWEHTGRYLDESKGFSQVVELDQNTLGILGGHHYEQGQDTPVETFELFSR